MLVMFCSLSSLEPSSCWKLPCTHAKAPSCAHLKGQSYCATTVVASHGAVWLLALEEPNPASCYPILSPSCCSDTAIGRLWGSHPGGSAGMCSLQFIYQMQVKVSEHRLASLACISYGPVLRIYLCKIPHGRFQSTPNPKCC